MGAKKCFAGWNKFRQAKEIMLFLIATTQQFCVGFSSEISFFLKKKKSLKKIDEMGSFSEKKPNLIFQLNFNFKVFWKKEASSIELISIED